MFSDEVFITLASKGLWLHIETYNSKITPQMLL